MMPPPLPPLVDTWQRKKERKLIKTFSFFLPPPLLLFLPFSVLLFIPAFFTLERKKDNDDTFFRKPRERKAKSVNDLFAQGVFVLRFSFSRLPIDETPCWKQVHAQRRLLCLIMCLEREWKWEEKRGRKGGENFQIDFFLWVVMLIFVSSFALSFLGTQGSR